VFLDYEILSAYQIERRLQDFHKIEHLYAGACKRNPRPIECAIRFSSHPCGRLTNIPNQGRQPVGFITCANYKLIRKKFFLIFFSKKKRKMLDLQHQYNNCTTISHMRVGPTYWGPPSCEGLLCSYCIGVVQESNPK